jgi:hypothetical protein
LDADFSARIDVSHPLAIELLKRVPGSHMVLPRLIISQEWDCCINVLCNGTGDYSEAAAKFKEYLAKSLKSIPHDKLIVLVSMFYQHCASWLIPQKSSTSGLSDSQLFTMLAHIVCTEIRIILDSTTLQLDDSDSLEVILPMCYHALECMIRVLAEFSDSESLDLSLMDSIQTCFAEVFLAISSFVGERIDMYRLEQDEQIIDNQTTVLSLRLYSNWVVEEESQNLSGVERALPLVVFVLQKK